MNNCFARATLKDFRPQILLGVVKPCETKRWGSVEHEEHLVVLREHEEHQEHPMRNKVFQEPDSSDFKMGGK